MRPYQYCSKEECIERQSLGQISELEATLETCRLSQSNRVLDPRIAVSKYRRSAAGGNDGRPLRSRQQLQKTLSHLIQICATLRSSPEHPTVDNIDTVVNFVVDRLRACQSDATRLMSNPKKCVPSSWHAKVIRVLIWLRYACCEVKNDDADAQNTARTIGHMRSTAYDAYWNTVDSEAIGTDDDDEMLCYHAISNICAVVQHSKTNYPSSLETSWNGITLEFQKRRKSNSTYPLWNLALGIASHARREEYYVLWKPNHALTRDLPILAKSILSGEMLLHGRYRTVQHYNKSFGKGESVTDMNRLLGIAESPFHDKGWSIEYANVFGIPVEETKNNETETMNTNKTIITMKLKEVAMPELDSGLVNAKTISRIQKSDLHWIFGNDFDDSTNSRLGISPKSICKLLEFGCSPSTNINPISLIVENDNDHLVEAPMSSLARALARSDVTNGVSCFFSPSDTTRNRPSPLQTALDRVKHKDETQARARKKENGKKNKPCRFFMTGSGCKWGDKCRFYHAE